jgi:hypothetical protein
MAGFGAAAVIPATSSAAGSTGTAPSLLCPAGATNVAYCTNYCPQGTLVGAYCETVSTPTTSTVTAAIAPQGPPTVFSWVMWGSKNKIHRGPALKFHVKSGINGAPDLKLLVLQLPSGLTFAKGAITGISVGGHKLTITRHSMTVQLRSALPNLYIYIKNHMMIESSKLRHELSTGKIKTLTFKASVTDLKGLVTNLAFTVNPTV